MFIYYFTGHTASDYGCEHLVRGHVIQQDRMRFTHNYTTLGNKTITVNASNPVTAEPLSAEAVIHIQEIIRDVTLDSPISCKSHLNIYITYYITF